MAKAAPNDTLDTLLIEIATGTSIVACSAEPTTYTEATSTTVGYALADAPVAAGDGGGDFTISDHATSGRKLVTTAQTGVTVDKDGTVSHLAIVDTGNSQLLYVTTTSNTPTVSNTNGDTITIPAITIQVKDPV